MRTCNQLPGIELATNALQHRGSKRVLSYGSDGFARTDWCGGYNCQPHAVG